MSQTSKPMATNRILHLSDNAQRVMPEVRAWAIANGHQKKLANALEYCRTFSAGPEEEWHSTLHTDMFFKVEEPNFICTVYRRYPPDSEKFADGHDEAGNKLVHYYTIGMIWDRREMDWGFHS